MTSALDPAWFCESFCKALLYGSTLLCIGIATTYWIQPLATGANARAAVWLARIARACTQLLLIAVLARACAHTAQVFGFAHAWAPGNLHLVAMQSRWGHAWRWQVACAVLLAIAAFFLRHAGRNAWRLYSSVALAWCLAIPLLGHAAGSPWRWGVHAIHVGAASAWLGTLAVMVLMPPSLHPPNHAMLQRFSWLAMRCAALVVLTGVVMAVTYVGTVSALFSTAYGRTLLLKLAVFAAILACGWSNWRKLRRRQLPARPTLILETVFATAIVALTAALTELAHP